eukprot:1820934-Prymnesium_polylepis.3
MSVAKAISMAVTVSGIELNSATEPCVMFMPIEMAMNHTHEITATCNPPPTHPGTHLLSALSILATGMEAAGGGSAGASGSRPASLRDQGTEAATISLPVCSALLRLPRKGRRFPIGAGRSASRRARSRIAKAGFAKAKPGHAVRAKTEICTKSERWLL